MQRVVEEGETPPRQLFLLVELEQEVALPREQVVSQLQQRKVTLLNLALQSGIKRFFN